MPPVRKNLASAPDTTSILQDDYVFVRQGNSVKRITLENFENSMNAGDAELLREVAWGVQIKQHTQSSPQWTAVGNQTMKAEFLSTIGRFLLTNNGKAAKLSVANSGVFADGTTLNEALGHVMFISPRKLYYRCIVDAQTGTTTIWWSMLPIGGKHFRENMCFGAYKGSMSGSALVSRSGVAPAGSKTINQFWTAAQVNGANFGLADVEARKFMIMLNLMQYANPNCQTNIGYGVGGSSQKDLWAAAASLLTGATKSLGDACGKIDITLTNGNVTGDDCSRVSLFGIEDAWNWQWEMVQGIFFGSTSNGQAGTEAFLYEGNRMPSAAELAGTPAGDFRQLVRPTSSNWVQEMILGEFFDILPSVLGGGSTSYWCDYYYGNATGQLGLWGGSANTGPLSGLGYAYSHHAWSYSDAHVGSRLAYYGPIEFVSGAELVAAA